MVPARAESTAPEATLQLRSYLCTCVTSIHGTGSHLMPQTQTTAGVVPLHMRDFKPWLQAPV